MEDTVVFHRFGYSYISVLRNTDGSALAVQLSFPENRDASVSAVMLDCENRAGYSAPSVFRQFPYIDLCRTWLGFHSGRLSSVSADNPSAAEESAKKFLGTLCGDRRDLVSYVCFEALYRRFTGNRWTFSSIDLGIQNGKKKEK